MSRIQTMGRIATALGGLVLIGATATGCTYTSGNKALRGVTATSIAEHIKRGVTTREEIKALFGEPSNASYIDSGLEAWTYYAGTTTVDPVNFIPLVNLLGTSMPGTVKYLVILFDENDRVKKYVITDADVGIEGGIFAED